MPKIMPINVKSNGTFFERTDTLMQYYQEVRGFETLSEEEEKIAFDRLSALKRKREQVKAEGKLSELKSIDKEIQSIKNYIINANLRFAITCAKFLSKNNSLLDMIEEGNIGLIEAVDTFVPSMGNKFITHAAYKIRQRINIYRQTDNLTVKKSNESKTIHILSNMTNKFMQENHREPTSDELLDYINQEYPHLNLKDSADVLTLRFASIDEPMDPEDSDSNIGNINDFNMQYASQNSYEEDTDNEHLRALVETLMSDLSRREKEIIKMHFGIDQKFNHAASIEEISRAVGLTKERVRQLIVEIEEKLKSKYTSRLDLLR